MFRTIDNCFRSVCKGVPSSVVVSIFNYPSITLNCWNDDRDRWTHTETNVYSVAQQMLQSHTHMPSLMLFNLRTTIQIQNDGLLERCLSSSHCIYARTNCWTSLHTYITHSLKSYGPNNENKVTLFTINFIHQIISVLHSGLK